MIEEEGDLTSLFDLTSAKRPASRYYESYKQQYQSQLSSGINQPLNLKDLPSMSNYCTTQTRGTAPILPQKQTSANKFENILAGPGSIIVDPIGRRRQQTLIEELQKSTVQGGPSVTLYQTEDTLIQQEHDKTQDEEDSEVKKWRVINQRTEELLNQERQKAQ